MSTLYDNHGRIVATDNYFDQYAERDRTEQTRDFPRLDEQPTADLPSVDWLALAFAAAIGFAACAVLVMAWEVMG